jgi:hypothetical protein
VSGGGQIVGGLGETLVTHRTEGRVVDIATTVQAQPHAVGVAEPQADPAAVAAQSQADPGAVAARAQRIVPQRVNDWLGVVFVVLGLMASATMPLYAFYLVIKFIFTH